MIPPTPQPPPNFGLDAVSILQQAEALITASAKVWDAIAQIAPEEATFSNAILPLIHDENDRMSISPQLGFLHNVSPLKELREASKEARAILNRDSVGRFSRADVFRVVDAVWQRKESLDPESQLYLEKLRGQFLKTGQGLTDEAVKAKVKENLVKISELENEHIRNLDSDVGGLWLTVDELQGVPQSHLDRWKADGDKRWVDHKIPNYTAVMHHAVRDEVRQKVWLDMENRVKGLNGSNLKEILVLRDEVARALGYKHHAELRESDRILKTDDAVQFLNRIRGVLQELGTRELQSLKDLKAKKVQEEKSQTSPLSEPFFPWDRAFFEHLAEQNALQIDQAQVAEYFPFDRCLSRMLTILGALFGVKFIKYPLDAPQITTWHDGVDVYSVWDEEAKGGDFLGYLYMDVFPRDHKYGHKGTFKMRPGFDHQDGSRNYPCSAFMTNYSPPSATRPSLLKIGEVVSCFHELGHALHNLTSKTKFARFHGSSVPRDFVEIPSIMLEHIFWNPNVVRMISGHYLTEEHPEKEKKLPNDVIERLIADRFAAAGLGNLATLHFSAFDLLIHTPPTHEVICEMNLAAEFNKLRKEICLVSGPEDVGLEADEIHSFCRFRFPIGYNTGYYTYLLSRSISYDIFKTKFQPLLLSDILPSSKSNNVDDIISPELRSEFRRYRDTILLPGSNVVSYMDLLKEFLGRDASSDAWIQMLQERIPDHAG
ncbi:thimet oligopeptidase [Trichoderma arundinaceum]|uniref:Thimet oligopeptidase n=1 Tax=Trichoderma arundinaceum TaxID=490622 RepID=A0A395NKM3_TRIAR|nr:thimet oligopeptidase [Trichoderma arundinaceum]